MEERYLDLEFIGGNLYGQKPFLALQKGENPTTVKIDNITYTLKKFKWEEYETANLSVAIISFVIGFLAGGTLTNNPFVGVGVGLIASAILGWKKDKSKLILNLARDEEEFIVYTRCNKEEFKEFSQLIVKNM